MRSLLRITDISAVDAASTERTIRSSDSAVRDALPPPIADPLVMPQDQS